MNLFRSFVFVRLFPVLQQRRKTAVVGFLRLFAVKASWELASWRMRRNTGTAFSIVFARVSTWTFHRYVVFTCHFKYLRFSRLHKFTLFSEFVQEGSILNIRLVNMSKHLQDSKKYIEWTKTAIELDNIAASAKLRIIKRGYVYW